MKKEKINNQTEKEIEESQSDSKEGSQKSLKALIVVMLIIAVAVIAVACVSGYINQKPTVETDKHVEEIFGMNSNIDSQKEKSPIQTFFDKFGSFCSNLFGTNQKSNNSDNNKNNKNNKNAKTDSNSKKPEINTNNSTVVDNSDSTIKRKDEFYNFLVLAKDKGSGNTDTIIIISFDVPNKKIALMQIPRDTCVLYNNNLRKINSIYASGYNSAKGEASERAEKGAQALGNVLVQNFGIVIDRFVIIDLQGFRNIVDAVGGVDVYVQKDMKYVDKYQGLNINLKKGNNHLDGKKAEEFVRFRYGYVNADLGRLDAQKIFMSAFLDKVFDISTITKIPELVSQVLKYVTTDISLQEATYFGTKLIETGMSQITMHELQGKAQYYNNVSYYSPYKLANLDLVNQYFNVFNKELGEDNVNPKMLVKEPADSSYTGGQTAQEIEENNPTLSYLY